MELNNLEDFKLESIPDGLPPDHGRTQDAAGLIDATMKNFFSPFRDLVSKLNDSIQVPPLTCIISDLNFTQVVAEELRIARICLWVTSSAAFWGFLHYSELIKRGIVPFKRLSPSLAHTFSHYNTNYSILVTRNALQNPYPKQNCK
ncbi:hypothetical protein AMTR_s00038p00221410 [Amborella trichopoda]|uniref:Uncharacterized protein n=2 Tax=Amborella trichopoda TaxID=13333 RepID=U5D2W3_AMBTC|nr:hypothetical protein AMTR_s00038p00221410 [Amborella trichopoda]